MDKLENAAWDVPIRGAAERKQPKVRTHPERPRTVSETVETWLALRDYSPSTVAATRFHLCGARAAGWREREGILTIDQLTAAKAAEYLVYLRNRGAAPGTVRKVKMLFQAMRAFCRETPGLEGAFEGDELDRFRLPPLVERIPRALTEAECVSLIAACRGQRDRLIVETMLLTGLRVSELCGLTLDAVHLDRRPAYLEVRGSAHNPNRTKNHRERRIILDYDNYGFGRGYVQRLRRYIDERPLAQGSAVFLSSKMASNYATPLTITAVKLLMKRLETVTGIHCNPHKFRHTFATRCVDQGVPMFNLQEALGHSSLTMVRRYYTSSSHAQAEAFYRAFSSTKTWQ